jgi:hypothetical protein
VFCVAFIAALCPAILNREVATVNPSEFAEPPNKSGNPIAVNRRVGTQESDGRYFARLLRPRCKRPSRRSTEQRDELAPLQLIELHPLPQPMPGQHIAWAVSADSDQIGASLVGGLANFVQGLKTSATIGMT